MLLVDLSTLDPCVGVQVMQSQKLDLPEGKAVKGISTHVLAILQRSGTSAEALAELAGITAPCCSLRPTRGGRRAAHGYAPGALLMHVSSACRRGVPGVCALRSPAHAQLSSRTECPAPG